YVHFLLYDTEPSSLYRLSLHDALPIWMRARLSGAVSPLMSTAGSSARPGCERTAAISARPSVAPPRRRSVIRMSGAFPLASASRSEEHRLNSSHVKISYAVFCLKNKRL